MSRIIKDPRRKRTGYSTDQSFSVLIGNLEASYGELESLNSFFISSKRLASEIHSF
jgi:hypothetical protein